jgi:hypothetical protein
MLAVASNLSLSLLQPVSKKIEEATDILTFLYKTLTIDKKLP